MSNILATLHPYSNIPPGSVYRGDGKFDILEPTPFTVVNVKRKDVNDAGTATFTAPGETIKTRLELRKLAQAEHRAQKLGGSQLAGNIGEVHVWNTPLTDAQMQQVTT
jgi:hypothetical protein